MNVLRKPWYSSLIIFLIWLIVIMRVQDLLFVIHHRPPYQFEGKSINFLELISIIFFFGAITYLKWWHQVGLKGLDNKLVEVFLGFESLGFELRYLRFLWLPILFFSPIYTVGFISRSSTNQGSYACNHQYFRW